MDINRLTEKAQSALRDAQALAVRLGFEAPPDVPIWRGELEFHERRETARPELVTVR